MSRRSQPVLAPSQGPLPPTVHRVAGIRNGPDELVIAAEALDTGLRYVSMTVYHDSPDGPVQDHRRRLCVRLRDVPTLVAGLLAAVERSSTLDRS